MHIMSKKCFLSCGPFVDAGPDTIQLRRLYLDGLDLILAILSVFVIELSELCIVPIHRGMSCVELLSLSARRHAGDSR